MKKTVKICKTVFISVLLVILFTELALYVARLVLPASYPKLFGYSKSVVMSGSMEDEIYAGDLLIYKTQDEYREQDIILFYDEKQGVFVTHRIVRIEDGKFITQGDANNIEDSEPVEPRNVHGKVISVLPGVGKALGFFTTATGLFSIAFIAALIIVYPYLIKTLKKGGNGDEE